MDKSEVLQNVLLGPAALVFVSVLGFLCDKTQAKVRESSLGQHILEGIRTLRGRWLGEG